MGTEAAALLAMTANFVTLTVLAVWRFPVWARSRTFVAALTPLVVVHAGRTVALQLYSAQANGYAIPDGARDAIVWGDQLGALLALATLVALWLRPGWVRPLAWLLVVATVVDLGNALAEGLRHDLLGRATDVSWLILTFYVPVLWVTIAMVAWVLLRHPEPSAGELAQEHGGSHGRARREAGPVG